jgi:hypothetical protein
VLLSLDSEESLSPEVVGAKAAWLARGRRAGLPVLPGLVVSADVSVPAMHSAADALRERGSGRARMSITQGPIPRTDENELVESARLLGEILVVRSSSVLEGSGEWSGAFTSYLEARPEEVPKAVKGCWASAFTVDALERHVAAEIPPGSAPMGVLVQRTLNPDFGGVARLVDDTVELIGVAGSPAPLVQGWEPGIHVKVTPSEVVSGESMLIPRDTVIGVARALREAEAAIGANTCEWAAVGSEVYLLQLAQQVFRLHPSGADLESHRDHRLKDIARLVRRFPGPLGERLVLGWALADPEEFLNVPPVRDVDPLDALIEAKEHADTLMSQVWGVHKAEVVDRSTQLFRLLRGGEPVEAIAILGGLRRPDPERSRLTLELTQIALTGLANQGAITHPEMGWHLRYDDAIRALRTGMRDALPPRIGFDRWQPFDTSVIMAQGSVAAATSAAPGLASGRMCYISDPHDTAHFRPRDVVVGPYPVPNYAALLFDASAIVTLGGSPAAHLFESARALAIPALCAVNLADLVGGDPGEAGSAYSLAVDGFEGRLYAQER